MGGSSLSVHEMTWRLMKFDLQKWLIATQEIWFHNHRHSLLSACCKGKCTYNQIHLFHQHQRNQRLCGASPLCSTRLVKYSQYQLCNALYLGTIPLFCNELDCFGGFVAFDAGSDSKLEVKLGIGYFVVKCEKDIFDKPQRDSKSSLTLILLPVTHLFHEGNVQL